MSPPSSAKENHRICLNKFNDLTCRCFTADIRELLALLMARVASIAVDMPSREVGIRAVFVSMYTCWAHLNCENSKISSNHLFGLVVGKLLRCAA